VPSTGLAANWRESFQPLGGAHVRHSNCEPEYEFRNALVEHRHFLAKEADLMLSNSSKTLENPGLNVFLSADHAIASMYGRIDMESSPAVRSQLLAFLASPLVKSVSIDLSGVTHMDSSGIATLIEALKFARGHRTELKLQGLQEELLRVFEFTGLLSLFNGSAGK
jgi:anti-sigma B factor antagonist